jgi:hypothetical protein
MFSPINFFMFFASAWQKWIFAVTSWQPVAANAADHERGLQVHKREHPFMEHNSEGGLCTHHFGMLSHHPQFISSPLPLIIIFKLHT